MRDLLAGLSVTQVKNNDLRKKYLTQVKDDLPGPNSKLDKAVPANGVEQPPKPLSAKNPNGRVRDLQDPNKRKHLISDAIKVPDKNINKVYLEIRGLDLDDFPHAAACLLRVFLEQSLDAYISHENLPVVKKDRSGRPPTLRERLKAVSIELHNKGKTPKDHHKAINAACNANGSLADPDNLHMKLHSKYHFSHKKELIHIWDSTYGPLLTALWAEIK